MSDALNRLNKLSRYVCIGLKLLMVLLGFAIAAMAIALIAILMNPDWLAQIYPDLTYGDAVVMMSSILTFTIVGFIAFFLAHRLFKNIYTNHTPFLDQNVKDLKYIAMVVLVGAILSPIIVFAIAVGNDVTFDPTVEINFGLFMMAFLVYLLSLVFKYGTALQKESDETL